MPTRWMRLYEAAIREQDTAKIPGLCYHARRAINDRLLEQARQIPNPTEHEELEEALRRLMLHELRLPEPN